MMLLQGMLGLSLPMRAIGFLLAVVALLNTVVWWRLQQPWWVTERELFAHLIFDVASLTVFLYLTGGSTNPFVMLYLVPLALTAASLPQHYTWIMVVLSTSCYAVLIFHFVPLIKDEHHHDRVFSLHIGGMWFGFVLSAVLIAWFGGRMAQAVRNREQQLARMREHDLRQERVVALGALAAGAAHELGTPLATLSILSGELAVGKPLPLDTHNILVEQIDRCKQILQSLAASAGQVRAEGGRRIGLTQFLRELVAQWQRSRPGIRLIREDYHGNDPEPVIIAEQTLTQAITNVLNNAADASPQQIEWECHWDTNQVHIEIADRGNGLAPEAALHAGDKIFSTKTDGLGLGLFLSYATLQRLGGEVQLFNRAGGGVVCRVSLPLATLQVSASA